MAAPNTYSLVCTFWPVESQTAQLYIVQPSQSPVVQLHAPPLICIFIKEN